MSIPCACTFVVPSTKPSPLGDVAVVSPAKASGLLSSLPPPTGLLQAVMLGGNNNAPALSGITTKSSGLSFAVTPTPDLMINHGISCFGKTKQEC